MAFTIVGNNVVVRAPKDKLVKIEKLITDLDVETQTPMEVRSYPMGDMVASSAASMLTTLTRSWSKRNDEESPSILADDSVNVLLVSAPTSRFKEIESLIHEMSKTATAFQTVVKHFTLKYAQAEQLAPIITQMLNATEAQKRINEINPSYYCFDAQALWDSLGRVGRNSVSGEHYLTDAPSMLLESGQRVGALCAVPAEDALSVNTPEQLARTDRILRARLATKTTGANA